MHHSRCTPFGRFPRGLREFLNCATPLVIMLSLYMFQFTMLFTSWCICSDDIMTSGVAWLIRLTLTLNTSLEFFVWSPMTTLWRAVLHNWRIPAVPRLGAAYLIGVHNVRSCQTMSLGWMDSRNRIFTVRVSTRTNDVASNMQNGIDSLYRLLHSWVKKKPDATGHYSTKIKKT